MEIVIGILIGLYLLVGLGFTISAFNKNMGCLGCIIIGLTWPLGLFFRGNVW